MASSPPPSSISSPPLPPHDPLLAGLGAPPLPSLDILPTEFPPSHDYYNLTGGLLGPPPPLYFTQPLFGAYDHSQVFGWVQPPAMVSVPMPAPLPTPAPSTYQPPALPRASSKRASQPAPALLRRPPMVEMTPDDESEVELDAKVLAGAVPNHPRVKGPWSPEEDAILTELVMAYGDKKWRKWSVIAQKIPGRIGKQCRERWLNNLDQSVKKTPWTTEEDAALVAYQRQFGNRWCEISKLLPGRPENAVKNRFNSICARHKTHSVQQREMVAQANIYRRTGGSLSLPVDLSPTLSLPDTLMSRQFEPPHLIPFGVASAAAAHGQPLQANTSKRARLDESEF